MDDVDVDVDVDVLDNLDSILSSIFIISQLKQTVLNLHVIAKLCWNLYNKRQCPRQQNNQQQQLFWGREFFRDFFKRNLFDEIFFAQVISSMLG